MKTKIAWKTSALLLGFAVLLNGCGGGGGSDDDTEAPLQPGGQVQDGTRLQDSKTFVLPDPTAAEDYEAGPGGSASFAALSGLDSDRWTGVLNGAAYRIEVPRNWNGRLVMYAHGYEDSDQLTITMPPIRRYLIENGYAWAASSFSKNGYDVRAGVEDTNALASSFMTIAARNGRTLSAPTRTYIVGHSLGGHVAGAAIEQETLQTAINKYTYNGAVPMCGVMGDTELFNYFAAYQAAAQYLAGQGNFPIARFSEIRDDVEDELFDVYNILPNSKGRQLQDIVRNLTGGERPVFNQGFLLPEGTTPYLWDNFGTDGTIYGILNKSSFDTNRIVYQLDNDPALSAEEQALNASVQRLTAASDANPPRSDGLRWIPKINGQFSVPVVTLHSLGDNYVPFSMQQIYRARAEANGNGNLLVQRAIRAPGHCDFTVQEQEEAFQGMVAWAEGGAKPAGDDVLTPSTVADPDYGCTFTRSPDVTRDVAWPRAFVREAAAIPSCS